MFAVTVYARLTGNGLFDTVSLVTDAEATDPYQASGLNGWSWIFSSEAQPSTNAPTSFAFVLQEKNTTDNQNHSVTVELACSAGANPDGCQVQALQSAMDEQIGLLRIDVLTP
jgi:hypothetical protein